MRHLARIIYYPAIVLTILGNSCDKKSAAPEVGQMVVSPASLDFGSQDVQATFTISNSGAGSIVWSISESLDWVIVNPTTGSIEADMDTVTVIINRPGQSTDPLTGSILINSNVGQVSVPVSALDTVYTSPLIFTEMVMSRELTPHGHMGLMRKDMIFARIDSLYSPCDSIIPVQADSVFCGEFNLEWLDSLRIYKYEQNMPPNFITLDSTYQVAIYADSLPDLTDTIMFPGYEPYLTYPADGDSVSLDSSLSLGWDNMGDAFVSISLVPLADSGCLLPGNPAGIDGIFTEVLDVGYYVIPASQINGLTPGDYLLVLNLYNIKYIDSEGFDPRSFIIAKTVSKAVIYLQ